MTPEHIQKIIENYFTLSFTLREILISDTDLISKKDLLKQLEKSLDTYGLSYADYKQVVNSVMPKDILESAEE